MKWLMFFLVFSFSGFANAYSHPQYFFQADQENSVFTPRLTHIDSSAEINGSSQNQTLTEFALEYEYGWLSWLSFGGNWGFLQSDFELPGNSYEYSGLRDFSLFAKAFYDMGPIRLRYGVILDFGSIAKVDAQDRSTNAYSGRYQFGPYIGFDYKMGASVFGAKLETEFLIDEGKTELATGGEQTETGGNTSIVGVFYEYHHGKYLFGGLLEYSKTSDLTTKQPGGGSTTNEIISLISLEAYSSFQVTKSFDLIPKLAYAKALDDELDGNRIDSWNIFAVQLDARWTF